MRVAILYMTECVIASFAVVFTWQITGNSVWSSISAVVFFGFVFGLVPVVSDQAARDIFQSPHIRCDACGNLRSESKSGTWKGNTICKSCSRDKKDRIEYAVNQSMVWKRLWKN